MSCLKSSVKYELIDLNGRSRLVGGDDAAVLYQSNPISTDNKSNDQDHTEVLGKMCQKN